MISAPYLGVSLQQAVRLTTAIVLIGVILDSAEMLSTRSAFAENGIFTWKTNHLNYSMTVRRSIDSVFEQLPFTSLVLVQLACAVASVLLPANYSVVSLATVFLIRILMEVRNGYQGREGADHMILTLLAAILLYQLAPGDLARRAVLWFISAETILAYVTAGVVKILSPQWRRGGAIRSILLTKLFGNLLFAQILSRWPWLSIALSWAVIGFELSAILIIFAGPHFGLLFVCCGILFHLGIAITQGLNLFVWAFLATYPSLIMTAQDATAFFARGR